jgi:hypothetical protein
MSYENPFVAEAARAAGTFSPAIGEFAVGQMPALGAEIDRLRAALALIAKVEASPLALEYVKGIARAALTQAHS